MAKLSDLIQATAMAAGIPDNAVRETARRVREAGYMQTGSAGRYGGAEMTDWDASNLLLGTTCSAQAKDAGEAVPLYRGLFGAVTRHKTTGKGTDTEPYMSLCPEPLRWLSDTARGLTLGMAIDRLIGMAREGELQALFRDLAGQQVAQDVPDREERIDRVINELNMVSLKLDFRRPRPGATISFLPYLAVDFNCDHEMPEKRKALNGLQVGDRTLTETVTHQTIFALGEALRS